jgi:diguanylate cyclase (GGDEF)-like protein/PAS domain S-box-containing protein
MASAQVGAPQDLVVGPGDLAAQLTARSAAVLLAALDAHAIVAITDRRGLITYANPLFCRISGYPAEQLLGQDHRMLNSGVHPRRYMRDMWRTIFRGEVWHGEFCNRARDGSLYWVKSTIVPVRGEDGKPVAFISLRTDVTEFKRMQADLARSEARFRRLFEQSSDALLLLDVDQGRFVDANDAAARMLGYERGEELAGMPPDALSPQLQDCGEASASKAPRMIETAMREGSHRFEWLHCSDRRSAFPVEVLLTPITLDGERLQLVTWRDISLQREHQQWTEVSSGVLDGIARGRPLADLLGPLFDFACSRQAGMGMALLRRSSASLKPLAVLSRGLDTSVLAGFEKAGAALPPCPLLGDPGCTENCPGSTDCELYRELRDRGRVEVVALDLGASGRASLLLVLPQTLHAAPERLGATPWQLWLDLLRLALDNEQAREQQALSQAMFESTAEGIAVCDADSRVLRANRALVRMLDLDRADRLIGKSCEAWFEADAQVAAEIQRALQRTGSWLGERRLARSGREARTWLCSASRVGDAAAPQSVMIFTDVTEQRAQRERIEHLAFYDPLTRLPNRSLLLEQLEQQVFAAEREAGELGLIYLDLDRFKEVNDSCGHAVGDQLLTMVAGRLRSATQGRLLARMGGDEFMLLVEHARSEEVAELAAHLIEVLRQPVLVESRSFSLDASVGISLFPMDARSADELMKHADIAMYQAKRMGGGTCFYRSELGSSLNRRLLLADRLKRALQEGRLRLHYQPQIDLRSGRLAGAEALLRWQEPDMGWVAPSEFIKVAESSGLMVELGEFVLEAACAQLRQWRDQGLAGDLRVSINLSPLQLAAADFQRRLQQILQAQGVPPNALELELTESTLVADPEAAIQLFEGLAAAGTTLAIDDFGTGYSSLAYLKRFPASRLKIDRGFVSDMLSDSNDAVIVETVIAMARALRLETVAEGVEQPAQAQRLAVLGCTYVQGFLYAPALTAAAFAEDWLLAQR